MFSQEKTHPFSHQKNQCYQTSQTKPIEVSQHRNQQVTFCLGPLCLVDQIQAQSQFKLSPQISCLITLRIESSIISIDGNITDNIIKKVINVKWEKCRTKNGALRNSSINWILLGRLPIKNHSKLSIAEKRRNNARYLT